MVDEAANQQLKIIRTKYYKIKEKQKQKKKGKRKSAQVWKYLQKVLQLIADIWVLLIVVNEGIVCNQRILWANVDGIINLPVNITYFPCRMEQTLNKKKHLFLSYWLGEKNLKGKINIFLNHLPAGNIVTSGMVR